MITLDAHNQSLGRLASKIVYFLTGKNKADYQANIDRGETVKVINIKQIKFTGNKLTQKNYYRHSGHPGNLKTLGLDAYFINQPKKILSLAVQRMLPKNRLQAKRLKRLIVE